MVNLPDSLYEDYTQVRSTWYTGSSSSPPPLPTILSQPNLVTVLQWINDIHSPRNTDFALHNLAINRYNFERLPLLLWNSTGTVTMLLQEIVRIYRYISLPYFNHWMRVRMYNILLLFQCITHHPETRSKFIAAKMVYYLYPLIDIRYNDRPCESIRLGALGVITSMLKFEHLTSSQQPIEEGVVIRFLMDSGVLGHCKRPIEIGCTESKIHAAFILHKIISTSEGLQYCCVLADRFFFIDDLLKKLLIYLSCMDNPNSTLFNFVLTCYIKLSQKSRARNGIRKDFPVLLFNRTFNRILVEDPEAVNNRNQLMANLQNEARH